jgi:hypothetical protein
MGEAPCLLPECWIGAKTGSRHDQAFIARGNGRHQATRGLSEVSVGPRNRSGLLTRGCRIRPQGHTSGTRTCGGRSLGP